MTQSCHTGTDVGACPLFFTTNDTGTVLPEKTPLAGGVMRVTIRSGRGTGAMLIELAATVVLLLELVPSATVCVALVVTISQRVPGVCGRMICCVRCAEAPMARTPSKVKLATRDG